MRNNYTVIDGHAHTFSSDNVSEKIIKSFNETYGIEFINSGTGTIPNVIEIMDESGIDYTIMANFAPPKILHDNNTWTLKTAQRHSRLVPLVSFHPDMGKKPEAYVESYIDMGAKGIKIHPMAQRIEPGDTGFTNLYRFCSDIDFPIVFHCGRVSNSRLNEYSDIDKIEPVVRKYPRIPFVLTHMAGGNIKDVLRLAERYENIYFDTSIVITGNPQIIKINKQSWENNETVEFVVDKVGAERILFGSDYPWGSPKHDVDRFLKLNLSSEQKRMILGENSIKLLDLRIKM